MYLLVRMYYAMYYERMSDGYVLGQFNGGE